MRTKLVLVAIVVAVTAMASTSASASAATAASGAKASSTAPTRHLRTFAANASLMVTSSASSDPGFSFSAKSVFVGPSKQDCTVHGAVGGLHLSEHGIVIGKHVWSDEGSGFKNARLADLYGQFMCGSSEAFWKSLPFGSPPSGLTGTSDTINGIKSTKYDLSNAASSLTSTGLLSSVPSGVSVTTLIVAYGGSNRWVDLFDLSATGASATACSKMTQGSTLTPPCTFVIHVDVAKPNSGTLHVRAPSTK